MGSEMQLLMFWSEGGQSGHLCVVLSQLHAATYAGTASMLLFWLLEANAETLHRCLQTCKTTDDSV
jgi:hypothetical protein